MKIKTTNNIRYIKGTALSLITATFLLSGCGSSGIDDVYDRSVGETTTQADYSVQVVDDAVRGSKVMANECSGYEEKGDGWYTLTGCKSRPKAIIANGGYMTIDDTNISMGFPLMVNTNMIAQSTSYTATPLTTLLATVNDYAELEKLQKSLGFATIQDMFKDDNNTRGLQQTLNSFFIEAQNSGVDINNFADFTKDFREMVIQTNEANGLDAIKKAKDKLKEDFDSHPDKYMNKYGVVFSGFVTNTDYNDPNTGTSALLKNIGNKFRGDENQVIFSGFIFDDIIGSSNDNYDQNATITIQNLNTSEFLGLNDNNDTSIQADAYGKYTVKIDKSKIISTNSYLLKGTTVNTKATPETSDDINVTLKSILTGDELLAKFKTNLNTADIPDLTISNVTTAKVAILDKKGVDLNNTEEVLEAKKTLETTNKETLLDVATGIKTIIDGSATISGGTTNTYDYIKTTIDGYGVFDKPDDMEANFDDFKTKIEKNKTLFTQLTSTQYEKFKIEESDLKGKRLVVTVAGDNFPTTILLFENGSYTEESKLNNLTPIFNIGKWAIDTNGNLTLTNIADESISTIALDKIELAKATYNNAGQFTGTTTNPRGSITKDSESKFIELITLVDIDLTKHSAPMVEFTSDNLKNKRLYEVYPSNGEYEDAVYIFDANGVNVQYSADVQSNTGTQIAISTPNGILTVGNDTFKIKKAYPTKLIVSKNNTQEIELFYSAVNAAASAQIKTYDNEPYKVAKFTSNDWNIDSTNNNGSINLATISTTPFVLKASPIDNVATDYTISKAGIISDNFLSTQIIGTKTELAITKNLGDSGRQRAKTSTRYVLPNFDETGTSGLLLVEVQLRYNKVVYNLKVRDAEGIDHNILDIPVTIVEENTLNKKYQVMTVLLDNQVAIRVFDDINSYYQYIDLANLWSSKPNDLKYFKYPTALKNSVNVAYLDDDGTGTLYKGKMNTPIEAKVSNFEVINGKLDNSYTGGYSTICTVKDRDTTPDNFSFTPVTASNTSSEYISNSITVNGINAAANISITGGQYSLDGGSTWTNEQGTVSSGQTVKVKLTSSSAYSTITTASLNIGGLWRPFNVTTKAAPATTTPTNSTELITSLVTQIFENNSATDFETWGATPTLEYNSLTGTDISFLSEGFGDVWYETSPYWKNYGFSNVTVVLPTSTTSGALHFTDYDVHKSFINGEWIENNTTKLSSQKLDYVSPGVFILYNDTNTTAQEEEIKFVKEFSGTELNSLDLNVTFDGNDKGAMIVTKALTTYYDWHKEEKNWSSPAEPTTYSNFSDFITARQAPNGMFVSKITATNSIIGIAFESDSNGTSGNLVEVDYSTNPATTTYAGTWSITNNILNINSTVSGYDYTPAFTLKDGVIWRGEKRLAGDLQAGILFNSFALEKLKTSYLATQTEANSPTVFTNEMIAGNTFYEVYFNDGVPYQTTTNKNIRKFVMNADGNFTAYGLLGDDAGHIATGTWSIADGKLTTSVTNYDGNVVTLSESGTNTIQLVINGGIQTSWVNDTNTSDTDINYYFTTLAAANSFGYSTNYYTSLQDSDIAEHVIRVSNTDTSKNKIYYSDHTFSTESSSTSDEGTWSIVDGKLFHRWSNGEVEVHSFNQQLAVGTTLTNETYNATGTILGYNPITAQ